ncbi:MAG: anthranilate synthase component I [Halobacteriota archaeon]|nr:anthranilate synthase component I [Halobacteriota archaeon]
MQFEMDKEEFVDKIKTCEKPVIARLCMKIKAKTTPLQVYTGLCSSNSYLLESVEKGSYHARFSFVGYDPDVIITLKDRRIRLDSRNKRLGNWINLNLDGVCKDSSILDGFDSIDALRAAFPTANGVNFLGRTIFDRQTFLGGAIGYLAYDLVYDCWLEKERLESERKISNIPDAQFALTTKTIVFDHKTDFIHVILTPFVTAEDDPCKVYEAAEKDALKIVSKIENSKENSSSPLTAKKGGLNELKSNMSKEEYERIVTVGKKHIMDGDIFQVVLSMRYEGEIGLSPLDIYRRLREVNPSPYMYLFKFGDLGIIGASPETLLTVHNRRVITNPIAGTCPRGKTDEEGEELARAMLADEKERAEHVMLVDLGRNDVRMVSKPGTVKVDDFMSVLKYSHVQHIESTVSGELRNECDQFDATRAIFPAGTLSGAPKIRAMEIIDAQENDSRGIYGGGVGYYSWDGDADFAIVIRTVVTEGNRAYVQAGAGIVADSDPESEYYEVERKMAAMRRAIELAGADR